MAWTAPSTWVASAVLTAAQLNQQVRDNLLALSDRIQVVRKGTAENVISSTALQADNELSFTVVAGQTYTIDLFLIFSSGSSAIDAKVGFSFPAGTMSFGVMALDPAVGASGIGSGTFQANSAATSSSTSFGVGVSAGETPVRVTGSYVCTTGGTVTLLWAQNTNTATNMTLSAGSTLTAIRASV